MHLRRKRIVHFVVQQISTLLADGNELLYRLVFLFQTYCRHISSHRLLAIPISLGRCESILSLLASQTLFRAGAVQRSAINKKQYGEILPTNPFIFIVKSSVLCRAACVYSPGPLPALRVRVPAAKYINIDALRSESVTRETLLRYTLNSIFVNVLV